MNRPGSLYPSASRPASEVGGRLFVIACSLGIATGVVVTAGMLLAAAAFATADTLVIPFLATFEGFLDAEGVNAVTITGSWGTVAALTSVLAVLLSTLILRRLRSRPEGQPRG